MGLFDSIVSSWSFVVDATSAIFFPGLTTLEYLSKPTIDKTVSLFYNATSTVTSLAQNGTLPLELQRLTPGVAEAGLISGVITPLISFGVAMARSFITIIDWGVFFLIDPVFTVLLYEWFVIIVVVEKKRNGDFGGGGMLFKLFEYQFIGIRVIYEISLRLLELAISFGVFVRNLIPLI